MKTWALLLLPLPPQHTASSLTREAGASKLLPPNRLSLSAAMAPQSAAFEEALACVIWKTTEQASGDVARK